jgi:hypothetical protein
MAFRWLWGLATLGFPVANLVVLAGTGGYGLPVAFGIAEAAVLFLLAAREYDDRPTAIRVAIAAMLAMVALTFVFGVVVLVYAFNHVHDPS